MKTLIDGREVASDSEEWRDDCLVRHKERVDKLLESDDPRTDALAMRDELIAQGKNTQAAGLIAKEALFCAKEINEKRNKRKK